MTGLALATSLSGHTLAALREPQIPEAPISRVA
jgi:hypothetical protein